MADVREVKKTGHNAAQNFDFRGVDAVVNAVGPALRAHEVVVLPHVESIAYEPYKTSKGTQMMCARVIVTYRFVGPGGDWLEATVAGEASDSSDKATAKAMSVAFRIALLQALALPTDDIDPDAQSIERSGESTAQANMGQGSVTSPRDETDAQAATAGPVSAASPASSAVPGGTVDPEAPVTDPATGEGAIESPDAAKRTTGAGASNYLSKDDQALLGVQYGSKALAVKAYRERFGDRIRSISDVTYEMRDEVEVVSA